MYYQCRECEFEECRGVLPGATCGLLYFGQIGVALGLLLPVTKRFFPEGLGLWWLIAAPAILIASFVGAMLIEWFLELLEWLVYVRRSCHDAEAGNGHGDALMDLAYEECSKSCEPTPGMRFGGYCGRHPLRVWHDPFDDVMPRFGFLTAIIHRSDHAVCGLPSGWCNCR